MAELLIQLTKRTDGGAVLRCARADGTVTWQRQEGRRAAFFPLHDLAHYAIEGELGFARGFYGLIADGWDIDQTTGKSPRGPLPPEALEVEHLVGLFDLERTSGTPWTAADVNAHAAAFAAKHEASARQLSDSDLERVRRRLRELLDRWHALPPGETMELPFERGGAHPS